jgi:LacI family transcriptional regulator
VNHLLRTGRTSIPHITGSQRHVSARLRDEGGRRALAPYAEDFVGGTAWGEWSEAWGRDEAHILMRSGEAFDAIFCGSDQIARGVAEALRESGLDIPGDVALVGFDNWEPMALGARPPLTTVDPQLVPLGRMAASRLLAMNESGMPESGRVLSPCDLVVRQSAGAATRRT